MLNIPTRPTLSGTNTVQNRLTIPLIAIAHSRYCNSQSTPYDHAPRHCIFKATAFLHHALHALPACVSLTNVWSTPCSCANPLDPTVEFDALFLQRVETQKAREGFEMAIHEAELCICPVAIVSANSRPSERRSSANEKNCGAPPSRDG